MMSITLEKPFAANTSVIPYDVRQMKKALNRLGYYQPLEATGITGIPDRVVFEALKQFQKDHNLPSTGEAKPDDKTIELLSRESDKTPFGFYIWRTVEDSGVRKTHAQFASTTRSWADSPDPGEDFNCRCWAEPLEAPVIKMEKDRIKSILENTPAVFNIEIDPKASSSAPWYENRYLARQALREYAQVIECLAEKHKVDPDLVKALMWSENSRGSQAGLGYIGDKLHRSETIMPMNINKNTWYKLITNNKNDLYQSEKNIEAATVLLGRIRDRIKPPTVAKIAAIWMFTGFEKTDENYPVYVERMYKEKPWEKLEKWETVRLKRSFLE
jgi:peptidoglycan hydrolase-like protein with peptidoglycan-binding domain